MHHHAHPHQQPPTLHPQQLQSLAQDGSTLPVGTAPGALYNRYLAPQLQSPLHGTTLHSNALRGPNLYAHDVTGLGHAPHAATQFQNALGHPVAGYQTNVGTSSRYPVPKPQLQSQHRRQRHQQQQQHVQHSLPVVSQMHQTPMHQPPIQPTPIQMPHRGLVLAPQPVYGQQQETEFEYSRVQGQQPHLEQMQARIESRDREPKEDDAAVLHQGKFTTTLKLVEHPPNLEEWRERLFRVDGIVALTEQQYVSQPFSQSLFPKCSSQPPANEHQQQVSDLLPPHRQCLLAPLDATPPPQALHITLLRLPTKGSPAWHQEVNRSG